jgi:hypothetical protein
MRPDEKRPWDIDVDGDGREVTDEQRKLVRAMVLVRKSVQASRWLILAAIVLAVSGRFARAQIDQQMAARLKATFICKVPSHTRWPAGALDNETLTVGVLGADPYGVGRAIETSISRERLTVATKRGGSEITVRVALRRLSYVPKEDAGRGDFERRLLDCDILFLTNAESKNWPGVRELIARKPILVFGDIQAFTRSGGMIEFVVGRRPDGSRAIDLHVNLDAVREAGLDLESTLLRIRYVTVVKLPQGQGSMGGTGVSFRLAGVR